MARLIESIFAHQEKLQLWLKRPRSGSFLFLGPSGVGKRKSAEALAQALVCEKNADSPALVPCGFCGACLRVEKKISESVMYVQPETVQIKMEQAQQVLEFLQLRSLGQARIIIIDPVTAMNMQAANALLKVLEEPPEGTYFFLLASSLAAVLPTIRSRSQILRFRSLSREELKKIHPAPDWVYRACQGSAESLLQLIDGDEIQLREKASELMSVFIQEKDFLTLPQWREFVKDKKTFTQVLHYWLSFLHDAWVLRGLNEGQKKKAEGQLYNPDQTRLLSALEKFSISELNHLTKKILSFEADLVIHRDPVLQLEELWVSSHSADL